MWVRFPPGTNCCGRDYYECWRFRIYGHRRMQRCSTLRRGWQGFVRKLSRANWDRHRGGVSDMLVGMFGNFPASSPWGSLIHRIIRPTSRWMKTGVHEYWKHATVGILLVMALASSALIPQVSASPEWDHSKPGDGLFLIDFDYASGHV